MKKIKLFSFMFMVMSLFILSACSEDASAVKEDTKPKVATQATDEKEFKAYAENITGRSFIKEISLKDEKGTIDFVKSFEEYKQLKPDSKLSESDYKQYFSTGEAIDKILVGESVRLLREFPGLKSVSITIPYEGKTHSIDLERDQVNSYLGFSVEDLKKEDKSWNKKFVDPILYNSSERDKFVDKFVSVK